MSGSERNSGERSISEQRNNVQYALTCDVGTTALKGALVRSDGTIVASASEPLDLLIAGDQREQDPRQWWATFRTVTHHMLAAARSSEPGFTARRITGLIFSGQMQDLIVLDGDLHPVRNAILYSDGRAAAQAETLADALGAPASRDSGMQRFLTIVGNPLEGSLPLPKLMWLRAHEPEVFARTRHILISSKDYLIARLTGACIGDVAACSTAGAMNIRTHEWAAELLAAAGIDPALLPHLYAPQDRVGTVQSDAAAYTGLAEGTPVYAGFGDAGATTYASGVTGSGQFNINLGTSGWVATVSDKPFVNRPGAANLAFGLSDGFVNAVPFLNAGDVHRWATRVFAGRTGVDDAGDDDYAAMHRLLAASAPGAGGVLCLPYLVGERFPVMNPAIRGAYTGIAPTTTRADLARAALEGVAFSIRQGMESFGHAAEEITVIGGGAREPAWCQMLADILGSPVEAFRNADIMPAVALAAIVFSNPHLPAVCRRTVTYTPDSHVLTVYEQSYRRFLRLYPALAPLAQPLT